MKTDNKWFILGAGSIGCLWGIALQEAGKKCSMVIRPESLAKYQGRPLLLEDHGSHVEYQADCVGIDRIPESINYLIISLKAPYAIEAVKNIQYALAKDATVIILLNGMGIQHDIARLIPGRTVWIGSTSDGVWTESPLNIHHAGKGPTWLGLLEGESQSSPLPHMQRIDLRLCNDIETRLWHKLVVNGVINGLTAKYRCKNGELLSTSERYSRVLALAQESEQLLNTLSIPMPEKVLEMSLSVIKKTADNLSSTFQDTLNHRPTELPWINGFLVEKGEKSGLEMRSHRQLMFELSEMGIK